MDVDLSTDLNALLPLVAPLLSGHSDVAIGTRLARGARVIRGPRARSSPACYNLLLHAALGARFSDAQCGFKAIRREQARALLPLTQDTAWFFDTELLVLAERAGLRIHEIPVDWIDDIDSRVDVVATALADLRGIGRLGCGVRSRPDHGPPAAGIRAAGSSGGARRAAPDELRLQIASFAVVGIACDDRLRAAVPAAPRRDVGAGGQRAQPAGHRDGQHRREPAAHVRDPRTAHAARHQVRGLIAFGVGLLLTSGALAGLHPRIPVAVSRSRSSSPPTCWPPSSDSCCTGPGSFRQVPG